MQHLSLSGVHIGLHVVLPTSSAFIFALVFSTFRYLVRRGIRFYGCWNTEPSQGGRALNYSRSVARSVSDPRWGSLPPYFAACTHVSKISHLCVRSFRSLLRPDCWLEVSIRKVLRPATSTQVFLGFPVSISERSDGSQHSKLPLHASHVALLT